MKTKPRTVKPRAVTIVVLDKDTHLDEMPKHTRIYTNWYRFSFTAGSFHAVSQDERGAFVERHD